MFLTIIAFVATLLVLVLVHEFGHFLAAKKFKVLVEEFGFGLPPRIFGRKIGETIFSLNAIPVGGFVKLFGEDETKENVLKNPRSFAARPVLQRIAIVIAGVTMNLFLAVFLFWIVLFGKGFKDNLPLFFPYQFFGADQVNQAVVLVGNVAKKSPAEMVGLVQGDRIIKINDTDITDASKLTSIINKNAGERVTLTVIDPEDNTRQIEVVPRTNPPKGEGPLGIQLGTVDIANISYTTPMQKMAAGFTYSYNIMSYSLQIFGSLIQNAIQTKTLTPVSQTVSGPVGISQITGSILETKSPLLPFLNLVALLSLNLAIINILPFPALDGGRLFFLLIEFITRKKINPNLEKTIHNIGMAILISLIVLVTFSDIKKLLP